MSPDAERPEAGEPRVVTRIIAGQRVGHHGSTREVVATAPTCPYACSADENCPWRCGIPLRDSVREVLAMVTP